MARSAAQQPRSMVFSAVRNVFLAARDDRETQLFLAFLGAKSFDRDSTVNPKMVLNDINNQRTSST